MPRIVERDRGILICCIYSVGRRFSQTPSESPAPSDYRTPTQMFICGANTEHPYASSPGSGQAFLCDISYTTRCTSLSPERVKHLAKCG